MERTAQTATYANTVGADLASSNVALFLVVYLYACERSGQINPHRCSILKSRTRARCVPEDSQIEKAQKYLPEGLNKAENCKNSFLTHSTDARQSGRTGPPAPQTHRGKETQVGFGLKTDFNYQPAGSTHLSQWSSHTCP